MRTTMRKHALGALSLLAALGLIMAACSLNPQPLPPGDSASAPRDNRPGADASVVGSGTEPTKTADGGAPAPPSDAGPGSGLDAASDDDAANMTADASDGSNDASDAPNAPSDAGDGGG